MPDSHRRWVQNPRRRSKLTHSDRSVRGDGSVARLVQTVDELIAVDSRGVSVVPCNNCVAGFKVRVQFTPRCCCTKSVVWKWDLKRRPCVANHFSGWTYTTQYETRTRTSVHMDDQRINSATVFFGQFSNQHHIKIHHCDEEGSQWIMGLIYILDTVSVSVTVKALH